MKKKYAKLKKVLFYVFIALFLVVMLFPFYWQVVTSLRYQRDISSMTLLPDLSDLNYTSYVTIFTKRPFARYIMNSLGISLITMVLCITVTSLAAYALARLRFKGKPFILGLSLCVSMFPAIAVISPMYMFISNIGLRNTWWGLVIPYMTFGIPLTLWYLTTFFKSIPLELEEAAKIDGCSNIQAFTKVVLPLAIPGMFTTAILIFIQAWNEYLFSLTINTDDTARTIPVGITMFRGEYTIPWVENAAAIVTVTVPLAIIVLILQKRIISGLTSGAVKG